MEISKIVKHVILWEHSIPKIMAFPLILKGVLPTFRKGVILNQVSPVTVLLFIIYKNQKKRIIKKGQSCSRDPVHLVIKMAALNI